MDRLCADEVIVPSKWFVLLPLQRLLSLICYLWLMISAYRTELTIWWLPLNLLYGSQYLFHLFRYIFNKFCNFPKNYPGTLTTSIPTITQSSSSSMAMTALPISLWSGFNLFCGFTALICYLFQKIAWNIINYLYL